MQHKEVVNLSLKDLVPYEAQPFHVIDDEAMTELAESVKIVGVLVPIIVRQIKNNKYEIISGHRRKRACEIAGVTEIPATIMELDDDEAAIMLVDCNLQRENLLPSEKGDGETVLEAEVPMAEMTSYAIDLRSMTQSRGQFTFAFVRYEDCPAAAQEKAIAEAKAMAEAE